jgi:DNA repair protein RecO (recombination protein O)
MQKVQLQPAYVLHARPFRESSQLLELLTRDAGRVGLVARGSRGAKSRWRGVLQPFRPLLVSWSRRGELGTLTDASQVAAPPPLLGEALYCGLYINELTLRLLMRDDPHPEVFEQYRQTLEGLVDGGALQPVLRLFEKQLLDATGFGLILDHEHGSKQALDPDSWYDYQPERGPVRVSASAQGRSGVVPGSALLALDAGEVPCEQWRALRLMMRRVLRHRLGDRPLVSETLYRGARPSKPGPAERTALPGEQGDENE